MLTNNRRGYENPHRDVEGNGSIGHDAEQYIHHLEEALPKYGIADSRLRLAHFFAQVLHESGCMRFDMENLNYSSEALWKVFGKYFTTKAGGGRIRAPAREDRESRSTPTAWATAGRPAETVGSPGPRTHPADRPEQLQGFCRVAG